MTIFVNGQKRETSAPNVQELLAELQQQPQTTLVEHNGIALRREEWGGTRLGEADRLELLRVVAGG